MDTKIAIPQLNIVDKEVNGNVTINGVPIKQKVKSLVLDCGNCHNIISELDPRMPIKERLQFIKINLSPYVVYCPLCGYKLDYSGFELINAEITTSN